MQLHGQVFFPWHGIHESVQAVDDDDSGFARLYRPMYAIRELTGRELGNVDLMEKEESVFQEGFRIEPRGF